MPCAHHCDCVPANDDSAKSSESISQKKLPPGYPVILPTSRPSSTSMNVGVTVTGCLTKVGRGSRISTCRMGAKRPSSEAGYAGPISRSHRTHQEHPAWRTMMSSAAPALLASSASTRSTPVHELPRNNIPPSAARQKERAWAGFICLPDCACRTSKQRRP